MRRESAEDQKQSSQKLSEAGEHRHLLILYGSGNFVKKINYLKAGFAILLAVYGIGCATDFVAGSLLDV